MLWTLKTSMMITATFMANSSPMALLIIMIMISLMSAMYLFLTTMSLWTSVMLIMVYVSGIMVLFMFAASLTQYDKTMNKKMTMKMTMSMAVLAMMFMDQMSSNSTSGTVKSFKEVFSMNMTLLIISTIMIMMMASMVPKIMMIMMKGMKTSS